MFGKWCAKPVFNWVDEGFKRNLGIAGVRREIESEIGFPPPA